MIKVGIDLSNIRSGGGVTHIREILLSFQPEKNNIKSVIIWASGNTLNQIENRPWLIKIEESLLNRSLFFRIYWQRFHLTKKVKKANCDILFVPGGTYRGNFEPFVTMSQNLLPFEPEEINRYKFSLFYFKLFLLRFAQLETFKKANGVIFLTEYARKKVLEYNNIKNTIIIPHGINKKFFHKPKIQKEIIYYSKNNPIKLLYVSFIGEYKHQWNVVEAIKSLYDRGFPIKITFIGSPSEKKAYNKFKNSIRKADPKNVYINYFSNIPYNDIQSYYQESDIFIFASSCEAFGQILTEAMANGLPIVCSNLSAMPEILKDNGLYFNPLDPFDIENSIEQIIASKIKRTQKSEGAYLKSKKFSWNLTSELTFNYINNIYLENKK